MTAPARMLELCELAPLRRDGRAMQGISLSIHSGEYVGLIGPNGAGKSTLARALAGSVPHRGRRILRYGSNQTDISRLQIEQVVRLGIVYVPAEANVFEHLTVADNLALVAPLFLRTASLREETIERFGDAIAREQQIAGTLSGGEKRLLGLARGWLLLKQMISRFDVAFPMFILDEPTTGLHPIMIGRLEQTLRDLQKSGVALFIVEQDEQFVTRNAGTVLVMESGQICEVKREAVCS